MFTPNWTSVGVMLLPSEIVIILAYKLAPLHISGVFILQVMGKKIVYATFLYLNPTEIIR